MREYTEEELDAIDDLVAEKIMGWERSYTGGWLENGDLMPCFLPSTTWKDAGIVLEKSGVILANTGVLDGGMNYPPWWAGEAGYDNAIGPRAYYAKGQDWHERGACATTPQLAICLAALKKAGMEVQK